MSTVKKISAVCALAVSLLAAADRNPSDSYYDAIRANDLGAVRQLLKSGASVDTRDSRGGTPLHYAAAAGTAEMVRELIAAGANVNARTSFEATPLMWCAADVAKARLLVEKGADVNARSKMGHTALNIAAAQAGSIEAVRYLLDHGAGLSKARDELGMTPLLRAVIADDSAMARLLLEKGDDPKMADGGGRTPLMFAAGAGNVELVRLLLAKGSDVNAQSMPSFGPGVKNGPIAIGSLTPLLMAASGGSPEIVRILLDAGAKADVQDVRGMTPLMLAAATDRANESIVKLLLAKKPALNVKSKAEETAWIWAAKFQHPAILPAIQTASAGVEAPVLPTPANVERAKHKEPAVAAERALALMLRADATFLKNGGCFSCHAQNITTMATAIAREKKIPFDQAGAAEILRGNKLQFTAQIDALLERFDPPAALISSIALLAMGFDGAPADRITDALVLNLAAQQSIDGRWIGSGGVSRPPTADGDMSGTAISIYALRHYAPPARKSDFDRRIAKAAAWLMKEKPVTTEDTVMQLLGAKWSGADSAAIGKLARQMLALQRQDGGWAQTSFLKSDAYATATALYALHAAGRPTTDPAFHRGVQFLLDTQAADGSWYVASRAPKFQPYFDGGFPYGHDQWISQWATGWAAIALSL